MCVKSVCMSKYFLFFFFSSDSFVTAESNGKGSLTERKANENDEKNANKKKRNGENRWWKTKMQKFFCRLMFLIKIRIKRWNALYSSLVWRNIFFFEIECNPGSLPFELTSPVAFKAFTSNSLFSLKQRTMWTAEIPLQKGLNAYHAKS